VSRRPAPRTSSRGFDLGDGKIGPLLKDLASLPGGRVDAKGKEPLLGLSTGAQLNGQPSLKLGALAALAGGSDTVRRRPPV